MTVALGAMPSNAPLPVGTGMPIRSPGGGTVARQPAGNWMYLGPGDTNGMQIGVFRRTYRFWLKAGATNIAYMPGGWERFDWHIYLLVNGAAYSGDLNGVKMVQKAMSSEGNGHTDPWLVCSIEGQFYCEANTDYHLRLLTGGGGGYYYQHPVHLNMWAYT